MTQRLHGAVSKIKIKKRFPTYAEQHKAKRRVDKSLDKQFGPEWKKPGSWTTWPYF